MEAMEKRSTLSKDFLVGSASGMIAKTALYPIERMAMFVKKVQGEVVGTGRSTPAFEIIKRIPWASYCTRELQKAYCCMYIPVNACHIAVKEEIKRFIDAPLNGTSYANFVAANISAGAMAGMLVNSLFVLMFYPLVKKESSRGTLGMATVSVALNKGLYFGLYDSVKPSISHLHTNKLVYGASSFMLAYCSSVCAGLATYSVNKFMLHMVKNVSPIDAMRKEGVASLFKGFSYYNIIHCASGGAFLAAFDLLRLMYLGNEPG